ncbi:uncharacterized protein LOC105286131 isoform X3 [Ooceraea biroi]|uniref:uncharacterized protein LOC105286131 isoform X3 n=1 Tax=Ooceraea biroi TaxID=2015173 RepID=UPI000F089CC9|nr:uncharacterized protein LOC105286131 isoform X3 [Ooceraea biroi]
MKILLHRKKRRRKRTMHYHSISNNDVNNMAALADLAFFTQCIITLTFLLLIPQFHGDPRMMLLPQPYEPLHFPVYICAKGISTDDRSYDARHSSSRDSSLDEKSSKSFLKDFSRITMLISVRSELFEAPFRSLRPLVCPLKSPIEI